MGLEFGRMKRVRGVSRELSEAMVGWMEKQMAGSFALKRGLNNGTTRVKYFVQILLTNSFIFKLQIFQQGKLIMRNANIGGIIWI